MQLIDDTMAGLTLAAPQGYSTFARYLPKLVRSYVMDAAETRATKTVPPVEEAVRRFIEEMPAAAPQSSKARSPLDHARGTAYHFAASIGGRNDAVA